MLGETLVTVGGRFVKPTLALTATFSSQKTITVSLMPIRVITVIAASSASQERIRAVFITRVNELAANA